MIAHEDVGDREQPDLEREGSEHGASFAEARAERRRNQPHTRGPVEERERPAERRSREDRPPEDVLRLLASSLPGRSPRKQHREDRRGQEKADASER